MTAADRLAALEQAHAAATPSRPSYPSTAYLAQDAERPEIVAAEWSDGAGYAIAECDTAEIAAAIVAEHNATPLLIAALRAVLDLADELSTLADLNDARASEHHAAGRGADFEYRFGRSISYGQAATKIRTAIDAALGVDSGQQT